MNARTVTDGVQWVGAVDWDRRLFDELIPLPEGTSYNAYLVRGSQKTALIDSVDPSKADILFSRLDAAGVNEDRLHRVPSCRTGSLRCDSRRSRPLSRRRRFWRRRGAWRCLRIFSGTWASGVSR